MLTEIKNSGEIIYAKSEKGREEMTMRSHGLQPMQRRVLILIDGIKDLYAIAAMVPPSQLQEILPFLAAEGFIEPLRVRPKPASNAGIELDSEKPLPVPALPPVIRVAAEAGRGLTGNPATIRQVKDFMTTTAQTYLGLLSAPVIQRIEQAKTADQLMAVAGHWNMALRDSQQGKRFASPYLEQVKAALVAGAEPVFGTEEVQIPLYG